jgi:SAM-dependent methyltransferase
MTARDEFAHVAQTYDWTEQATDDLPFWRSLAGEAEGPILEIGAGTGRVTLAIASEGRTIVGQDISPAMLARALAKWEASGRPDGVDFVVGDFRKLALEREFALILAPARVFEHALTDEDREAAFQGCAAHLLAGGCLALHVWGPPWDKDPSPGERSRLIPVAAGHAELEFSWREERDFARKRRDHYYRIVEKRGRRRVWDHGPIELRWYTAEELDRLGEGAGLSVEGRYQDFLLTDYEPGAQQLVWVFRKPA